MEMYGVFYKKFEERSVMSSMGGNEENRVTNGYSEYIKPIFDITFAGVQIVLLFPIIIIIAVAVKITSKGPILFRQERFGKNSEKFVVYKFRTMINDSPILSDQDFYDKEFFFHANREFFEVKFIR